MKTQTNQKLELARKFVQFTGKNVFLTGKAGTGKTTFLHQLKEDLPKRMIVVAPTGVAAINAGGVTIHSFFQLPFGPVIPGYSDKNSNVQQKTQFRRFSKEKINIMKSLDLLVIDEISMVRADMLDGIDETLRRFRRRELPFGGVQLLMIGDMQQLAPVIKDDEWEMLRDYYATAFFFSSRALKNTTYVSIELIHVYRQSDQHFIQLLNRIRDNKPDNYTIEQLNKRYRPDNFDEEGYITLTTHNAKAARINQNKLKQLNSPEHIYTAEISGKFPEYIYPTDYELKLKKGAQVMFVKNDPSPEKEFFNGKIGKIVGFDEDNIIVRCPEDDHIITVNPIEWNNYKYTMDQETKEIKETVEGTFIQIPLKLAWAITIHKSQGLTFEKAIIDANAAFAFGQVYVALSRCKSLDGLVLSSRIEPHNVKSSSTIGQFNHYVEEHQPGEKELINSRKDYQLELLVDLFNFKEIDKYFYTLARLIREHVKILTPNVSKEFVPVQDSFRDKILKVGEVFQRRIPQYFTTCDNIENNPEAQERIAKAAGYFTEQLKQIVIDPLPELTIDSDNKTVMKRTDDALENAYREACFKFECLEICKNGFALADYIDKKAKASLSEHKIKSVKKKKKNSYSQTKNKELYDILRSWRTMKAQEMGWEAYQVFHQKTLFELSERIPGNRKQLKSVYGFGKKKLQQFGDELLEVLNDYRLDQGMELIPPEEPVEKKKKPRPKHNTREITLNLWNSGLDVNEIAERRKMAFSTISGHIAYWVKQGIIPVEQLVSDEKIKKIKDYYFENPTEKLSPIKEALGDEVSFNEIRFVVNAMIFEGKVPV